MFDIFRNNARSNSIAVEFECRKRRRMLVMVIFTAALMLAVGSFSAAASEAEGNDPRVLISYQVNVDGETQAMNGPENLIPTSEEKYVPVPKGMFMIPQSMLDEYNKNDGKIVDYVIVYSVNDGADILHRARRRCHTHRNGDRHCPE